MEIDASVVINEVEKRGQLFDTSYSQYYDRNVKKLWEKCTFTPPKQCQDIIPNWGQLSSEEKTKYGSAARKKRKYIYFDRLPFLELFAKILGIESSIPGEPHLPDDSSTPGPNTTPPTPASSTKIKAMVDKDILAALQMSHCPLAANIVLCHKELSKLNYKDGHIEDLQEQKRRLSQEIRSLRYQLDNSKSRNPHLNFVYRDPENNFNRASVKGLVCRLVKVKQPHTARALEVAAGGKLYNVIVDTEVTSKKLLKKGQLQRRTTIIPLNKISGHSMNQNTIRTAEQLVGKDNVQPALSLIEYDRELRPAMEWIFGQVFICRDMATARKVTFHERIMKKHVILNLHWLL
uniref:SMC hinge domain-containing protein n=1 Tax=Timema douglasi TaxID=61478 RepID=A0A7R8VHN6_TIMDO|nr:unnamed protein product [Timema douglasi]